MEDIINLKFEIDMISFVEFVYVDLKINIIMVIRVNYRKCEKLFVSCIGNCLQFCKD